MIGADVSADERVVERLADAGIALPTFEQLADPGKIPQRIRSLLGSVDPDGAHPLNLFRVHWYNAADHLKKRFGAKVVVAEALECPTLLRNGFGEHNIQGIGDKHVPLIHNVMNTDVVVDVSDRDTDALNVLFNTPQGRSHLRDRGVDAETLS